MKELARQLAKYLVKPVKEMLVKVPVRILASQIVKPVKEMYANLLAKILVSHIVKQYVKTVRELA